MNARFEAYMAKMRASRELAAYGFEELAKRNEPERYLAALEESGFFLPKENPVPEEDEKNRGFFRIPFWPALPYLRALADRASVTGNETLGRRVLEIARDVTRVAAEDDLRRSNYHTNRIFAEILGAVPSAIVTSEDVDLAPVWLGGRFDRGLVSEALSKGLISRLLASESPASLQLALRALGYCAELERQPPGDAENGGYQVRPVTEGYWLRTLLLRHASTCGRLAGASATALFAQRLRTFFGSGVHANFSSVARPSIGDHEQNHSWEAVANAFVEALRDATLAWLATGDECARGFVEGLLREESRILQRIGLYIAKEKWASVGGAWKPSPEHFVADLFHESYELVAERWTDFSPMQREATLEAIEAEARAGVEDRREYLYRCASWFRALEGKGVERVEATMREARESGVVERSEHPDFAMYHESRVGPGPSPYAASTLEALARTGKLIETLNAHKESESWRGSPVDALAQELEDAIVANPAPFVRLLDGFRAVRAEYFYALLSAIVRVRTTGSGQIGSVDDEAFWRTLISTIGERVESEKFWKADETYSWKGAPEDVVGVAMKVLVAGTSNDERAYPPSLLPEALSIIRALLARLTPSEALHDDPMHQAINTPRGKVVEALISHALRACRVADHECGAHAGVWANLEPTFDAELGACANANFEFSTLIASRLSNLLYLSRRWAEERSMTVFSLEHEATRESALDGLAYGSHTKATYRLLRASGVIRDGFRHPPRSRQAREWLVEAVGLAYLWGEEELEGESMTLLQREGSEQDLVNVAHLFWGVKHEGLDADQIARILNFAERCVELWGSDAEGRLALMQSLARLSCYLEALDDAAMEWLLRAAPAAATSLDLYEVAKELERLAEANARQVLELLRAILAANEPDFDFDGHLLNTIRKLASAGLRVDVLPLLGKMGRIGGADALYGELRGETGGLPA